MKILLVGINSKYIHSNPALYYLKAYAVSKDTNDVYKEAIVIKEYTINNEINVILRDIYEEHADCVAFSVYIWNVKYVRELCELLTKVATHTHIWLGGPEVSFLQDSAWDMKIIRGIMTGEGERNFFRLCEAYRCGKQDELPAIMPAEEENFDDVVFPYTDLSVFDNRIVYYETSRGCPYRCSYCLSCVDRHVRLRSISLVEKELQFFLDAQIPLVKFVDRTFNCDREHTRKIVEYIKNHDNNVTCFHFEIAAEILSEAEIELFSSLRPGLVQLEIGVQTINTETLKAINRKSDIHNLRNIVSRLLKPQNMHIHLDLIAGLPYEDMTSFRKSFNEVYAMHGLDLQLGFLKVLKGTPIYEQRKEYEIVYSNEAPYEVLSTKWLSFEDILELKRVDEMLEVYYNSHQFETSIAFLESRYSDCYTLYLDIASYYKNNNLDTISHSRYARYDILRNWWLGKHPEDEAEFTCCLLHDLYLRDNIKSRPDYGKNYQVDKVFFKNFFESKRYLEYIEDFEGCSPITVSHMVHIEKRPDGLYLYDYRHRNPLTGNAKCVKLNEE